MKIRPVGAELFHADRRAKRHDEANSHCHSFANTPKNAGTRICTEKKNWNLKPILSSCMRQCIMWAAIPVLRFTLPWY